MRNLLKINKSLERIRKYRNQEPQIKRILNNKKFYLSEYSKIQPSNSKL